MLDSILHLIVAAGVGASYGLVFYSGAVTLIDRAWARAEAVTAPAEDAPR